MKTDSFEPEHAGSYSIVQREFYSSSLDFEMFLESSSNKMEIFKSVAMYYEQCC